MKSKLINAVLFCRSIYIGLKKRIFHRAPAVTVHNLGISGNTADDLLNRVNRVTQLNPDLVILMIGTNDARRGGAVFENYKKSLSSVIGEIKKQGATILLVKPPPIFKNMPGNKRVQHICNIINGLSIKENCYVLDIYDLINNNRDGARFIKRDGFHPNRAGQKFIGQHVYTFLVQNNLVKKTIVCFGDSITARTGLKAPYPEILQNLLNR